MSLMPPEPTRAVLTAIEQSMEPILEFEVGSKLSGIHQADGLSEDERTGAFAESAAFNFVPTLGDRVSPWETYYGPAFSFTKPDGQPGYAPDIAEIDSDIIDYWRTRAGSTSHPILKARYSDLVWDLSKPVSNERPQVLFAQGACDSYLEAVSLSLLKEPTYRIYALKRALDLALSLNDSVRVVACKNAMLRLFEACTSRDVNVWSCVFDVLTNNRKCQASPSDKDTLVAGLERFLVASTTLDQPAFDPWIAQIAAHRLARHYESCNDQDNAHRVIKVYGGAFENIAAKASPTLAMSWLQLVYDEYRNRGMAVDAQRAQLALIDKAKNAASDLKPIGRPFQISPEQIEKVTNSICEGTPEQCLTRVAAQFIPSLDRVKRSLEEMLTSAPLMARISITRIDKDHFSAEAGSIEQDLDGRIVMQLAERIIVEGVFLDAVLPELLARHCLASDGILDFLYTSPIFDPDRRTFLKEGLEAHLKGDYVKAVHVLVPQIEYSLCCLLSLLGVPHLKPGRNGTMQLKNLNDILREPAVANCLKENLRMYLLTLLADGRGPNVRNVVCHGMSPLAGFTESLSNRIVHALLTLALVRGKASVSSGDDACSDVNASGVSSPAK